MATTTVDRSPASDDVRSPSVLVVLVTRDAVAWLRGCLESLAAQTHPRLGVVAVDNGSSDGTLQLLRQALGEARVVALGDNRGIAGALAAATQLPAARAADYLLLVHDDVALAPDAVERFLEAAEGIKGVERVGVVGPKIVDWDQPRVLREVGRSTDRFGHPYTPLQDGELDQGQYDRVLEVLFVSSAVMLVSREAWQRTGPFDERFAGHHDDLDFCWRARLAGFRVLMTPLATARHRGATSRGERPEEGALEEHALLRRARRAGLDAQGLRGPHVVVAPAGVRRARTGPDALPGPVAAVRGRVRPAPRLGVEPPAPSRDAQQKDPGPIRPFGGRPQDPPVHGVHLPAPQVVRAGGGVPRRGSGGVRRRGARAPAAPPRGQGRGRPPGPARVDPRDRARGARGAPIRRSRGALGRGARRVPRRPRRLLPGARVGGPNDGARRRPARKPRARRARCGVVGGPWEHGARAEDPARRHARAGGDRDVSGDGAPDRLAGRGRGGRGRVRALRHDAVGLLRGAALLPGRARGPPARVGPDRRRVRPAGTGTSVSVRRRAGRGVVDRRGVRPGDRPARRAVRAREPRRRPPTRSWVGAGRARRALGGVARLPRRDRGLGRMRPRRSPPRSGRRTRGRSSGSLPGPDPGHGPSARSSRSPRSCASRGREIRSGAGPGERCWWRSRGPSSRGRR